MTFITITTSMTNTALMTFPTWMTWLTAKRNSAKLVKCWQKKRFRSLHHIFHPLVICTYTYFTATGILGRSLWTACSGSASSSLGSSWSLLCSGAKKEGKNTQFNFQSIAKVKITPLLQHIWWKVPGSGGKKKRWIKRPPEFAGGKNIPWCGRYFNTLNKFFTKLHGFWVSLSFGFPWRLRVLCDTNEDDPYIISKEWRKEREIE